MATTLQHSALGTVKGKAGDGVTQYLGIKYGQLKTRFSQATLPEYTGNDTIDATKYG